MKRKLNIQITQKNLIKSYLVQFRYNRNQLSNKYLDLMGVLGMYQSRFVKNRSDL